MNVYSMIVHEMDDKTIISFHYYDGSLRDTEKEGMLVEIVVGDPTVNFTLSQSDTYSEYIIANNPINQSTDTNQK